VARDRRPGMSRRSTSPTRVRRAPWLRGCSGWPPSRPAGRAPARPLDRVSEHAGRRPASPSTVARSRRAHRRRRRFDGAALVRALRRDLDIVRLPHWTAYFRIEGPPPISTARPSCRASPSRQRPLRRPDEGKHGFKVAGTSRGTERVARADGADHAARSRSPVGRDATFPALAKAPASTLSVRLRRDAVRELPDGRSPGVDRLWFVGGLSGHGFKHAPASPKPRRGDRSRSMANASGPATTTRRHRPRSSLSETPSGARSRPDLGARGAADDVGADVEPG